MKQEFTLSQVVLLTRKLGGLRSKTLPVKLGYMLGRNLATLSREADIVEGQRRKLCERFANKDEQGLPVIKDGSYDMTAENEALCNKEFSELLDTTVSLDIMMVSLDMIEAIDGNERYDTLTVDELDALALFVRE